MEIININGISYNLIRSKIKNVYISIKDGKVYIKAPNRISMNTIEDLVVKKSDWIKEKLETSKENREVDLINKNYIYILNKKVSVNYIDYNT